MKFEMELHPNFVSDLVVKQLQEMYEHTKEDYFGSDPEETREAIAVVLDYFMAPSEYEEWKATHRSLVDECVEGFDAIATATGTPTFKERYSPEDVCKVDSYIGRVIESLLKKGNTHDSSPDSSPEVEQKWVGLTQEELQDVFAFYGVPDATLRAYAQTIEAKLKEKNSQ